jgi:hypothetical protein
VLPLNNTVQPVTGKLNTSLSEETHWSSVISSWIAAALLGSVTSLLVWAFMKGFGWRQDGLQQWRRSLTIVESIQMAECRTE